MLERASQGCIKHLADLVFDRNRNIFSLCILSLSFCSFLCLYHLSFSYRHLLSVCFLFTKKLYSIIHHTFLCFWNFQQISIHAFTLIENEGSVKNCNRLINLRKHFLYLQSGSLQSRPRLPILCLGICRILTPTAGESYIRYYDIGKEYWY